VSNLLIQTIKLYEWNESVYLTAYLPNLDHENRPAVIICPGGGYVSHSENEMEPVALQFLAAGYCPFILNYSIGAPFSKFPTPIVELAKSICLVKEHSRKWGIDSSKVFLCGFSTGAHMVALLGTTWDQPYLTDFLGVESHLIRPDAMILGYPILNFQDFRENVTQCLPTMASTVEMMFMSIFDTTSPTDEGLNQWNPVSHISKKTIPTFIWSTQVDQIVPKISLYAFLEALDQQAISHAFHLFEKGGHGISCATSIPNTKEWFLLATQWLSNLSNN